MSSKPPLNPFHFLLGVSGIVFLVTAIGYTMVILRAEKQTWVAPGHEQAIKPNAPTLPPAEHPLIKVLRERGGWVLLYEIGAVAVFAFAAIGLDRWRDMRAVGRAPKLTTDELPAAQPKTQTSSIAD